MKIEKNEYVSIGFFQIICEIYVGKYIVVFFHQGELLTPSWALFEKLENLQTLVENVATFFATNCDGLWLSDGSIYTV